MFPDASTEFGKRVRQRLRDDYPPARENPAYLAKYAESTEQFFGSMERFAREYSVVTRVRITKVRGL